MKVYSYLIAAVLVLTSGLSSARAADIVLMDENFDSYVDGSGMPDQAAFVTAWPRNSAAILSDATLSQAQAQTSPNSVSIAPIADNNHQRQRRSFTAEAFFPDEKLVWSFDILETGFIGNPQRVFAGLHAGAATATNQLIQMGINNNQFSTMSGGNFYMARILGYTPPTNDPDGGPIDEQTANGGVNSAGMFFKLNDFAPDGRVPGNTWRNLKVEISKGGTNGEGMHYHFYVNNVLAERVLNIGTAGQANQLYDAITIGSGLSHSTNTVFFDNMKLELFFAPPPGGLDGDYNDDGKVDAADYVVWRQYEGTPLTLPNDPHGGTIGQLQFDTWRANFGDMEMPGSGTSARGGVAAVPEPAGLALVAVGLVALVSRRRGR